MESWKGRKKSQDDKGSSFSSATGPSTWSLALRCGWIARWSRQVWKGGQKEGWTQKERQGRVLSQDIITWPQECGSQPLLGSSSLLRCVAKPSIRGIHLIPLDVEESRDTEGGWAITECDCSAWSEKKAECRECLKMLSRQTPSDQRVNKKCHSQTPKQCPAFPTV